MDRVPAAPLVSSEVRLHAWYRSAHALLRQLSRALNQGQTILRADSGLPVGTHLVLVMSAECLSSPLEVRGTVTAWRVQRGRHAMTLRYDFDPGPQRRRLDEALAELRAQTRRPRRAPRVPLTLATAAAAVGRGLEVTVVDLSRTGARLRLAGKQLPAIERGSRILMRHQGHRTGMRRSLRLTLRVRWIGPQRRSGSTRSRIVGGHFVQPSDSMRQRLRALLRFEETRPQMSLEAIEAPPGPRSPAGARTRPRRRRSLKR